jgi:predicted MFS family arabinose efflux permease
MASLVVAIAMAAVLLTGNEEFWHAYVAIALIGAAWALEFPSRRAMIHDLVGGQGVTNAIALDSIGMNASNMLGPALGGVLISQVDVAGGYVAVVCFYVVSVTLVWMLRRETTDSAPSPGRRLFADLLVGAKYAVRHRTLLAVVLITVVMNVLFFPYRFLIPVIARDVLGVGPSLMGLMDAITGLGASMGAIAIASSSNVQRHGRIFLGGSIAASAFLIVFSFSDVYAVSVALLLFLGLSTAGFATMQATVVMLVSRSGMRGKALGVVSLAIGTSPVGSLVVGAMADRFGASVAITISASVGLGLLVVIGVLMPSIRARIVAEDVVS